MLVLLAWTTSLSAQITREQADEIVWQHIKNEVTPPYLLYVNVNTPSEGGITVTTFQEETFKAKYACWAYYLNENPGLTEPSQHRYLFVKENDGNLLEVITSNDMIPDLTQWEEVLPTGLIDIKENGGIVLYPNPTSGELQVTSYELQDGTLSKVEVFDMMGRVVETRLIASLQDGTTSTSGISPLRGDKGGLSSLRLDISHLPVGVYFIRITTETGTITEKIIKK